MVLVRQWSSQWFSYLGDFVVMVCGNFLRISSVCELGDFVLRERDNQMKRDKEEREKQYEMVTKRRERNNESGREMCMNTFLEKKN